MSRTSPPATSVPSAPAGVARVRLLETVRSHVLRLIGTGEGSTDLAQLVEIDPALTGSVLRAIRCPIYAASDGEADLAVSIEALGMPALERMIRAHAAAPADRTRESAQQACRQWLHALAVAAAARCLANGGDYDVAEEAYRAGLVHDVGRLAAPEDGDPRACVSRAEGVLKRWRINDHIVAAAVCHRHVRDGIPAASLGFRGRQMDERTRLLVTVVARADQLASALGYHDGEYVPDPLEDDATSLAVAEAIELELRHAGGLLGMDPGGPEEFLRRLTNEEIRVAETNARRRPADASAAAVRIAEIHSRLLARRGMPIVSEILECGLRDIRDGLDLDRVALLEPDPEDPNRLRGRVVLDRCDIQHPNGVRGLELQYDPRAGLAGTLDGGPATLSGADDALVAEQLGAGNFVAAPLRAGSASFGVVVADQFLTGRDVAESDAAVLGLLCNTLGLVLENMALDCQGKTLRSLAEKDELTGINNRRNIVALLESEIRRSRRFGTPLSIALLDVDFFKKWNDVYGHQTGDQVLQAVAQIIASCSREVDYYGRYGGEEFLVVLPETPVQHAVLYAERLRLTLQAHGEESLSQYEKATLTLSVGITSLDPDGDNVDRMVRRADTALYAAKKHGRNRVCVEAVSTAAGAGGASDAA